MESISNRSQRPEAPDCRAESPREALDGAYNPRNNIVDFRGLDSSIILNFRGGILMHMGNSPESLTQAMLVGVMLVGRLGVFLTRQAGITPQTDALMFTTETSMISMRDTHDCMTCPCSTTIGKPQNVLTKRRY